MLHTRKNAQNELQFVSIEDPVPHHSTISWNRRKRFNETNIFQEIFDEIVLQAMNHKMVEGRVLFTDSTHLKANANKNKFTKKTVEIEKKKLSEALQIQNNCMGFATAG